MLLETLLTYASPYAFQRVARAGGLSPELIRAYFLAKPIGMPKDNYFGRARMPTTRHPLARNFVWLQDEVEFMICLKTQIDWSTDGHTIVLGAAAD